MDTEEPIPGKSAIKIKTTRPSQPQLESVKKPNPLIGKYQARAVELKIKPVEGGDWFVADGVKYTSWGSEEGKFPTNTDPGNFEERLNQIGTYDLNNSTLAYVDEQGIMHIGHATEENLKVLEKAGYRRGVIWVPFSNGEVPSDPELRQKYIDLREKGREINRQKTIQEHLRIYSEIAERKGIKPIKGGLFMMVDGIEYRFYGNETGRIEVNTDGSNMAIHRVDQVGTYDSNNGIIAFVDEQGRMWVGASTEENWKVLQKAGYTRGGIWVPFSNGEIPTDRVIYEQLRDVLTGKPAEQLRAERAARVEEIIGLRKELFGEIAVLPDKDELYARVADRTEREYINIDKLIEERLHPITEIDNAGYKRTVYAINNTTFSFKGREELPIYSTLTYSRSTFLGETPNWVETEDFQKWQEQLKLTQTQESASQHYIVNKTLQGVIELAIQLGSKDASLPQLRDQLARGVYSERALTLIDALIALNYVDFAGFNGKGANTNAEAIMLLSLLGDADAQTAVAEAVDTLRQIDQGRKANRERRKVYSEPLKPQELVCVHATRYKPEATEGGGFLVYTTFDATKGKVLRNTVHTALNHKVAAHIYGSWEDAGYVVISPFESMIKANGLPAVLNTVDTYWSRNPGEPLIFADGTLVAPGGGDIQGLYETEGNIVKFKSEGLDRQDLINIAEYARRNGYLDDFSKSIESAIEEALHPYGSAMELQEQWDFDTTQRALSQFLYGDEYSWGHQPALLRFLAEEIEGQFPQNLETRIKTLIERSGASLGIKSEVQDKEKAIEVLVKTLANRIRSTMFTEINEIAVREAITARGFNIKPGGMWAWGDSWTVTGQTVALGEELGVLVGAHTDMIDHELTERFKQSINQAIEGEKRGNGRFNWTKYNPIYDSFIPKIDSKTRRVLYASGLLTARG